jgi:hypothetical protein
MLGFLFVHPLPSFFPSFLPPSLLAFFPRRSINPASNAYMSTTTRRA